MINITTNRLLFKSINFVMAITFYTGTYVPNYIILIKKQIAYTSITYGCSLSEQSNNTR